MATNSSVRTFTVGSKTYEIWSANGKFFGREQGGEAVSSPVLANVLDDLGVQPSDDTIADLEGEIA